MKHRRSHHYSDQYASHFDYPRSVRVAESLRREMSSIMLTELKDPRIGMVVVSRIDLTPDLRHAKVYVSFTGEPADLAGALNGLKSATGYIRRLLRGRMDLKRIPELVFERDKGAAYSIHINETLEHLHEDDEHLS